MELTKRRLKEIIAEEMNHLAETGDLNMITKAEKKAFEIILEKLTPKQLEEMGLKRVMVKAETGSKSLKEDSPESRQKHDATNPKIIEMKKEVARLKRLKAAGAKYDKKKLEDLERQLERHKMNPGISS